MIGIITCMVVSTCVTCPVTGTISPRLTLVAAPARSTTTQNYTTMTFSDPVVASLDPAAAKQLLQGILHNIISGTGTKLDGTFAIPNANPASLLATRDIVEGQLALDGSVPHAESIARWIWSRHDLVTGAFTDEYAMNWTLQQSGSLWIASNRYSPLVATACAFDALRLLRQPLTAAFNASIATYILSCYDTSTDAFTGSPTTTEPTLQDTYWAIKTLASLGQLAQVNAGSCAAYINSLIDATGLYQLHNPILMIPAPEYLTGTICSSRLAIETLMALGRLGTINTATFRDTIMGLYDTTNKWFMNNFCDANRTALATAEALDILDIIGFSAGFTTIELPQVIEMYARTQLFTGGWAMDNGCLLTPSSQCARIVTDLVHVAGRGNLGTIDLTLLCGVFAASLAGSDAAGMAGYEPFPDYNPSFDACRAIIDITQAGGMLDPAGINAAKVFVAAADTGTAYPDIYPGSGTPPYIVPEAYRTFSLSGAWCLALGVQLKIALGMPFSAMDLFLLLDEFKQLQITTSTPWPGLQGLCISSPSMKQWLTTMGGLKERAASLESTLAVVQAITALKTYGNGSTFIVSKLLNLGILYSRLASAYRESGTIAWFERESPATFQSPAGVDNQRLRDARLVLEIINSTRGFDYPAIKTTISLPKLANLALTEPRHTITDIDNALAILALLNRTIAHDDMVDIVGTLARFRVNGTAWFARLGLPNLFETVKAYLILSRFAGIKTTLEHVMAGENGTVQAMAGTTMALRVELVNCFRGDEPAWTYTCKLQPAGITGTGGTVAMQVAIPLSESVLGPAILNITMPAASLNTTMIIPMTISGVLVTDPPGEDMQISTPKRASVAVTVNLFIASLDNSSRRVAALHGSIVATGMSVNDTGYFALVNGSDAGVYTTLLDVSPLSADTTYHVEASHSHCALLQGTLVIRCDDNLATVPVIVVPLGLACIAVGVIIAKPRSTRRRAP